METTCYCTTGPTSAQGELVYHVCMQEVHNTQHLPTRMVHKPASDEGT